MQVVGLQPGEQPLRWRGNHKIFRGGLAQRVTQHRSSRWVFSPGNDVPDDNITFSTPRHRAGGSNDDASRRSLCGYS